MTISSFFFFLWMIETGAIILEFDMLITVENLRKMLTLHLQDFQDL